MRGKRELRRRPPGDDGLIPARAGKTSSPWSPSGPPSAHPRACGENTTSLSSALFKAGSSPRVRGKLRPRRRPHRRGRLIPARAGKTSYTRQAISRQRAHPRACGENADGNRGAEGGVGLIPARAGKTKAAKVRGRSASAHPRACGENALVGDDRAHTNGSSPRVRGKPLWADLGGGGAGLIPARAGKTAMVRNRRAEPTAHPRACGENNWVLDDGASTNGSSPRVRGKHI